VLVYMLCRLNQGALLSKRKFCCYSYFYGTVWRVYDAFKISLYRISEMVYSQALAAFFSDAVMYIIIWLLNQDRPPIYPLLLCFIIQCIVATLWSYGAHQWYYHVFPPRKTIIVYDRRPGMEQLIDEYGLRKK
jgi:hypothetical protein